MAKRGRKGKRSRTETRPSGVLPRAGKVEAAIRRAVRMIEGGHALEAIELLEPLLAANPRAADLHAAIGYAYAELGDLYRALGLHERAVALSRDPAFRTNLAALYLMLDMTAHALHAYRQLLRQGVAGDQADGVRAAIELLESRAEEMSAALGIPRGQIERGLSHMEDGIKALQQGNAAAAVDAARRAIRLLGDWPPPRNNLSLALFANGQPEEAAATAREVLAEHPNNIQALGNAIRFLVLGGNEAEARELWARLRAAKPEYSTERIKMAEAAAFLDDDESVYALLEPLADADEESFATPGEQRWVQMYLAVAEANLGKSAARRRLQSLKKSVPKAANLLRALKAGRPGPGWADRFPYLSSMELVTAEALEPFIDLLQRQEKMSPERYRSQMGRLAARFPQMVMMAEKLIWEEGDPSNGIQILGSLATPAAFAALRRFGTSQVGEDDDRMLALYALLEAGGIGRDETVRAWMQGEWRELQLRAYEVSDEPKAFEYSPQVQSLMESGLLAFKQEDYEGAKRDLHRVLELDPRNKEALNNLAGAYARLRNEDKAKELFQAALDIDPLYVFPRCNLAMYLLDEGDVDAALKMLRPLADLTRFHPQEMAFLNYTYARVHALSGNYDAARTALEMSLEASPDFEPARSLLDRISFGSEITESFRRYAEQLQQRNRARRSRLQAKLTTATPSLSEALALYTKDALSGMGRTICRECSWSGLRKAELLEGIVDLLGEAEIVKRVLDQLDDTEREALREIVARGGQMPWGDFDYENDLEESRYWNYHEPKSTMGRLRIRGLLVEATVGGELLLTIPSELRPLLAKALA